MAAGANGGFVVAWSGDGPGSPFTSVFARRFSNAGAPLASEFRVNTYTTFPQRLPSVASDASGRFVVAWMGDYPNYIVLARRFSSAGAALASEFQVNTYTSGFPSTTSVAASAGGAFVIAWNSYQDGSGYGIFARRFSSAGVALASEFQVNTYTANIQRDPAAAADADGDFVVAWSSEGGQDGEDRGLFARRFSSAGAAVASEFQINAHTLSFQSNPSVAADPDGDFVVVWQSSLQDSSLYGIFARRFSSGGALLASEFQVNTYTPGNQYRAAVATDANGDFVVTWESSGIQDGSIAGVFARRFSSSGLPQALEFQVNAYTTDNQRLSSVAAGAGGNFVVAWESLSQDGSGFGVFAQRFADPKTLDIDGNGFAEPLTDGLMALRYLFGFRGNALMGGAFDVVGCTRCDASGIEAYIAGITLPLAPVEAPGSDWQDSTRGGLGAGVFAERSFVVVTAMDIDGNGSAAPLTDGLLALRYLFGFRGATLVNGAVDLVGCTRCNATTIELYIAELVD